MVLINYQHINRHEQKDTFGGSAICMCPECCQQRVIAKAARDRVAGQNLEKWRDLYPEMFHDGE